ncbi:MAG: aminotransferase class IV, partial [Acetobacteraceae bacterium]
YGADRMQGIPVAQAQWRRPAPDTAPTAAKCTGLYTIGTLAKQQAEAEGCADALMLDWRGLVAETTGANVFLVIDGALHTPVPDCFLDGITRRTVMALAQRNQMTVVERPIPASDVARATEVFLAGTAAEVTAVRRIGPHCFTPGRITDRLMRDYDTLVHQSAEAVAALVA